jgi:hypothetical protein
MSVPISPDIPVNPDWIDRRHAAKEFELERVEFIESQGVRTVPHPDGDHEVPRRLCMRLGRRFGLVSVCCPAKPPTILAVDHFWAIGVVEPPVPECSSHEEKQEDDAEDVLPGYLYSFMGRVRGGAITGQTGSRYYPLTRVDEAEARGARRRAPRSPCDTLIARGISTRTGNRYSRCESVLVRKKWTHSHVGTAVRARYGWTLEANRLSPAIASDAEIRGEGE